jgi:hypothetical protein
MGFIDKKRIAISSRFSDPDPVFRTPVRGDHARCTGIYRAGIYDAEAGPFMVEVMPRV